MNFTGAVAGSGIRTIESEPDVPPGDVNLIAPVGYVNAGDAGIGSSGNINIAAQRVIGAANINFGGTATGVPPEVSGIGDPKPTKNLHGRVDHFLRLLGGEQRDDGGLEFRR